jgi:hypothetical protein
VRSSRRGANREPGRANDDVLLILGTIAIGLAIGLARRGSLRDFPSTPVRALWLALAGVVLQYLILRGSLAFPVLLASFACLIAFAAANLRAPGFAVILIGLALNTVVIAANRGMPVTREALDTSGQGGTISELITDARGQKHLLATDRTVLLPLGDVIGIPAPIAQAVSVGDLFVHVGIAWFIVAALRKRDEAEAPEPAAANG